MSEVGPIAFTGIVRAPEPSGVTPPRPFPLSTALRALPHVLIANTAINYLFSLD